MSENDLIPLPVFRFHVEFKRDPLDDSGDTADVPLCSGSFSECSGLEATMEPKVIREGGRNYGAAQRMGQVTFATLILKRGMTTTRDIWKWFELVSGGAYAYRLAAFVKMSAADGLAPGAQPVLTWKLEKAVPIKCKASELRATGTEIAIEELHLAHEGLSLVAPAGSGGPS